MSELLALGISHKTAPVALRERLAFTEQEAIEFSNQATTTDEVREAVVISTCNRTEVYLVVGDPVQAEGDVLGLLARRAGIRPTELAQEIYSPRNCDAARQLYRVTAGLESMIVGEAEIQGQVRRAHEAAMREGSTGALTNRLFAAALTAGKRVRTETGIGSSRVSVPSVAVDLALSVLGGLEERHVVILGAGETSELTARALADQGAGTIFVANRHADRALSLAQRFGGSVVGLDGLPEQLLHADIVLSSTSSPHPIVGREELELVMRQRRERSPPTRSLLLIDIAVPRDIDPDCGELEGVTLYDIDDLQAVVARNLDTRASEVPRAEEIVEEEIQRFARWLGQLEVLPTVSALREHGNALVEQVLAENAGRWESASPRDIARVEAVARAVMSRLLHEPTIRLRSLSEARGHASLELVRELFGLRDDKAAEEAAGQPRSRIGSRPPSSPRSTTSSAAARAEGPIPPCQHAPAGRCLDADRNPWECAGARAGGHVAELLDEAELVTITTSGDSDARPPARGQDKSRWVDTIEAALLAGEIDLAVHSAKDVPGELAGGLSLLGAPARVAAEDVLCGAPESRCPFQRRARRHRQPASRRATAGGSRGPAGGRDRRQCRHAPAASSARRMIWMQSCSRVRGFSGWAARCRSARCSIRSASSPPPVRACSRSRDARVTAQSSRRCVRSPTLTRSRACGPSARWRARSARAATRRLAPMRYPPVAAA